MISKKIQIALMIFYVALIGTTLIEGSFYKSMYWVGALLINIAIYLM